MKIEPNTQNWVMFKGLILQDGSPVKLKQSFLRQKLSCASILKYFSCTTVYCILVCTVSLCFTIITIFWICSRFEYFQICWSGYKNAFYGPLNLTGTRFAPLKLALTLKYVYFYRSISFHVTVSVMQITYIYPNFWPSSLKMISHTNQIKNSILYQ